jgi:beta-glucosidase
MKTVTFEITATALRRWSVSRDDYVVPAGAWTFLAGASSEDVRQIRRVEISGDRWRKSDS